MGKAIYVPVCQITLNGSITAGRKTRSATSKYGRSSFCGLRKKKNGKRERDCIKTGRVVEILPCKGAVFSVCQKETDVLAELAHCERRGNTAQAESSKAATEYAANCKQISPRCSLFIRGKCAPTKRIRRITHIYDK